MQPRWPRLVSNLAGTDHKFLRSDTRVGSLIYPLLVRQRTVDQLVVAFFSMLPYLKSIYTLYTSTPLSSLE